MLPNCVHREELDTPVAMSTPSTQVMVSIDHSQIAGSRVPLRNCGFRECGRETVR